MNINKGPAESGQVSTQVHPMVSQSGKPVEKDPTGTPGVKDFALLKEENRQVPFPTMKPHRNVATSGQVRITECAKSACTHRENPPPLTSSLYIHTRILYIDHDG